MRGGEDEGVSMLWMLSGAGAVLALVAGVAERRRHRRRSLDAVGWVPWSGILFLGLLVALFAAAYAVAFGRME